MCYNIRSQHRLIVNMAQVSYTYPAGKYYIGDLCYALDNDVMTQYWGKHDYENGTFDITSNDVTTIFSVSATAYGDGFYTDSVNGLQFGVDSGCIGILPFAVCNKKDIKDGQIMGGHIIESTTTVEFQSHDGIFVIGYNDNTKMIIIDTSDKSDSDMDDV